MDKEKNISTDWTKYYKAPKSKFSTITQRVTLKRLLGLIEKYLSRESGINIIELGGGNSCFAEGICHYLDVNSYAIVDNNELSIEKVKEKEICIECHCCNILDEIQMSEITNKYDVVYSVGLIEHFRGQDISKIISSHFKLVNETGLVIITFPTPTIQYRVIRKIMEKIGVWQFWDEKPLTWEMVKNIFEENGNIIYRKINRKLPLTQMIIVATKKIK